MHDLIIRGGTIYDGSGQPPFTGDIAIDGDTITAIGDLQDTEAKMVVDATGLAVAPGFINMLSWATESLIEDGRSQADIRQGVTLEVMGEGVSMGPLNDAMKDEGPGSYMQQGDIKYDVEWTTLGEYLEYLEKRGVSPNIASFVGSATLRIHAMGYDDREPTPEELAEMKRLLHQAMQEGAMGLSAALIYPPAYYADTDELMDLASVAAGYNGMYISHIRSEGSQIIDALDEFLEIISLTGVTGEIYHLKAAGQSNWELMDVVIEIIEEARAEGLPVTADMYTYPYSGTGLDSCIPPWAHEGGHNALVERIKDPETRERIKSDMVRPSDEWENMYADNSPEGILLAGFRKPEMKHLQGKTLAQVAQERGTSPKDTVLDLIVEDDSRVFTIYFSMSEDNLRKQVALPWVSFCSDAASPTTEGVFLQTNPHPRAYGSFARVLAKYVRDEGIIPLEEAIRRLTSFPAANLKIEKRGSLTAGYYADVVVFDPANVQDHATPEDPHQYATGMVHVFVNGEQVLKDGEHTGAKPGRVVRGPGYGKQPFSDYAPPLDIFLTLGQDYVGSYHEFPITRAHTQELIRMATDTRLLGYDDADPAAWGPMHARRRLGQLQSQEAIEPLMALFEHMDPLIVQDLPQVYSLIGPAAIPALTRYFNDPDHSVIGQTAALTCLRKIGDDYYETREPVLAVMVKRLEEYASNNPVLNSFLVAFLADVQAMQAGPLVAEVYRNSEIFDSIAGDKAGNLAALGVAGTSQPRPKRGISKPPVNKKKSKKKKKK